MKHRVIFPPADYWTDPPKENTVTDPDNHLDPDPDDDVLQYRGQLAAIELCRAVAASDGETADAIFAAEEQHQLLKYLVAGLTHAAVSLNRTVVQQHDDAGADEERVWVSLAERSATGLFGSIEINDLTKGEDDTA